MIDWSQPNLAALEEVRRTGRWTIKRKAALMLAIRRRELSESEALDAFNLSCEELDSWRRLSLRGGEPALRVTRLQAYR